MSRGCTIYNHEGYKIIKKSLVSHGLKGLWWVVIDYNQASITGIVNYFKTLKEAKEFIDRELLQ